MVYKSNGPVESINLSIGTICGENSSTPNSTQYRREAPCDNEKIFHEKACILLRNKVQFYEYSCFMFREWFSSMPLVPSYCAVRTFCVLNSDAQHFIDCITSILLLLVSPSRACRSYFYPATTCDANKNIL